MWFRSFLGILSTCLLISLSGRPSAAEPDGDLDEQLLKSANVGTDAPALMHYIKKWTQTEADERRIQKLIAQLGDDDFETRETASRELKNRGPVALPLLRAARKSSDLEVARRAEDCVDAVQHDFAPGVLMAAIRVLGMRKPAGAAETLLEFLPSTDNEGILDETRTALTKLAVRDGKADAAVVAALADQSPLRRAAAGSALARSGQQEHRPAVRKLLEDSDPSVRLQVGLALASAKEKAAFPVLIDLIDKLPMAQLAPVEDLLYRVADEKQPPTLEGLDESSRRTYRDAWSKWWKDNGDGIDLKRADSQRTLGYTLIVLLDESKILELNADSKVRWQIGGLEFPLDAQYLPGDRVLVAEHGGGRVTERNRSGKILWEHKIVEPFVAQRLPNDNTFIAGKQQLVEIDCKGTQKFSYPMQNGDQLMRANRLADGEILCVIQHLGAGTEFVHLDASGKPLHQFPVNVGTFGGRIQLLPNGHVLIPEMYVNRVAEYDMEGKVAWEQAVLQPIVATRLANGHTLVTSMSQRRAVEFDRNGKEVWEYKHETRVTRAFRR